MRQTRYFRDLLFAVAFGIPPSGLRAILQQVRPCQPGFALQYVAPISGYLLLFAFSGLIQTRRSLLVRSDSSRRRVCRIYPLGADADEILPRPSLSAADYRPHLRHS